MKVRQSAERSLHGQAVPAALQPELLRRGRRCAAPAPARAHERLLSNVITDGLFSAV